MTKDHGRLRILSSQTLYRGKVVQLKLDRVVEPTGVTTQREVVCHGGSVVVLPRLPDGRVVLVRQYRYAARRWLWELVAGGIEPGETPRQAAQRELLEETGYRARKFTLWCDFYSSPGFLGERMFLVEAGGLTRSEARPEADERIEVGHFTRNQLLKMLRRREIRDGKTLVGILWLLQCRPIVDL
jgi:ADP-ribose pyrophosphatase